MCNNPYCGVRDKVTLRLAAHACGLVARTGGQGVRPGRGEALPAGGDPVPGGEAAGPGGAGVAVKETRRIRRTGMSVRDKDVLRGAWQVGQNFGSKVVF